jgi:TonB-linked SusC/RagA family outer membrane protein
MYKTFTSNGKWKSFAHKILLIMRLTTVIIIASMLQVSASTFAQRVTLKGNAITLKQIFSDLKKQTGYTVIYSNASINDKTTVDANFDKTPVEDVIKAVLNGQPISYTVKDKAVILSRKEKTVLDKILDVFDNIDVSGRLVDKDGNAISGATITIKGTKRSVISNSAGYFRVSKVDENDILQISYVGYTTLEVIVKPNLGNVALTMANGNLNEVEINTGYYSVKEKERTGSISKISSEEISKQPVNNVLQAMQAKVPGVQINQNTGIPGGGFSVQIRGQNSIAQGNEPFYIINGVPFIATSIAGSRDITSTRGASPLSSINPNDIESIEILKDADATAIYGSRGANGVILITTKRGKSAKPQASISITKGIAKVGHHLALMNTSQYLQMRKEALANDKIVPGSTQYDVNGKWGSDRNIDWQDDLIGGTAPTTNVQTSLSGSSANITYLIGAAYYKEGTVFPGESIFKRSSGNFSLQYTSNNRKLNVSFDASYSQVNNNTITTDITQFIMLPPNYPSLLTQDGALNWENNTMYVNPIANTLRPYNSETNNLISNANFNYTIIPNLKMKASLGYTNMSRNEFSSYPLATYSPALNYGTDRRWSYFTNNSASTYIIEGQSDYSKQVGPGKLNMLVGTTFQQSLTDGQEIRGSGYTSDALMGNIAAASLFTIPARSYLQYKYTAIFSRVNYTIMDKYILNLTGRRDGSTRFGTDNRFANFGAVGAAWIISGENFVKDKMPFISLAKLRASYGVTGNDLIQDYRYLELWNTYYSTYQGTSTIYPGQIANPNYAWEINKKVETALEVGVLNDVINFSLGYYSNRSSNQLVSKLLAPSTGFQIIQDNLPAKVGNTGWEITLNTKNITKKIFKWSTAVNLTFPKNQLINYPGLTTSTDASRFEIGQPLSIVKLYNTSVSPETGLFVREDFDNNGIIDDKDRFVIKFVGRKYYGGLDNSISLKGFQFDFLFQFVKQSGVSTLSNLTTAGRFDLTSPLNNQPIELIDRWKAAGEISTFQKYSTTAASNTSSLNARSLGGLAIVDASFIRLKSISLSYLLPTNISKRININQAKFFVQGQNIFTITRYKGLDPETQSISRLPLLQIFTTGIQFTF